MKRLALGLMALALLAGCGVKSGLERPDPMWNREEAIAREREQLERQQGDAARARTGPAPGSNSGLGSTGAEPAEENPLPNP